MKMIIGKKELAGEQNTKACASEEVKGNAGLEAELKKRYPGIKEVKEMRSQRTKLYTAGNGKQTAVFYDEPIHYYDQEKEEYIEFDKTFIDNGDTVEPRAAVYKSRFNKDVKSGKIFEMEKDLCKVGLKSLDIADAESGKFEAGDDGRILLRNATSNSDMEYRVEIDRIKENIIINSKAESYEYNFDLQLENISIDVSEDGKSLQLIKKDSGMVEFYIPSPYMYDASGAESDAVYYEVEQKSDNEITIKVVADKEWINNDSRVFPVTIDPQIVTADWSGAYYNTPNYEDSIFRYVIVDGDKERGGNLKLYCDGTKDNNIYSKIIIKRNKLPAYVRDNFTQIKLKLKMKPGSIIEYMSIGGYNFYNEHEVSSGEIVENISQFFYTDEDEIVIPVTNEFYRSVLGKNNAELYPPVLMVEYNAYMVSLQIMKEPNKTSYIPGEKFDPTGMIVNGIYDDGSSVPIASAALKFEPAGTLATYDDSVKIIYREDEESNNLDCQQTITVDNGEYWFNDRRASENMENVYVITRTDNKNFDSGEKSLIVRLEHADGAEENENFQGTPLNAYTFNKIIKALKDKKILD